MQLFYRLQDESYKYVYGCHLKISTEESVAFPKQICCKNDWAVAQLTLQSDTDMKVNIGHDPALNPKGAIQEIRVAVHVPGIPSSAVHTHLVGLIQDDDHQYKSDLLMDESSIYVEAEKEQAVWIQVNVDEHVEAGTYEPSIKMYQKNIFEDEVLVGETSFTMEVLDLTLDKPRDYTFHLDLWQHNSNIARKYQVPLWSDEHFDIMEHYIKSLADLGQKAVTLIVSDAAWSGQGTMYDKINPSDLFEYSMVKIKYVDSQFSYDFSAMERYLELCAKYGIDREIEVFGLINIWLAEDKGYGKLIDGVTDGVRLRYYDEADGTYKYMRKKEELAAYVQALEAFFADKGVLDKVRLLADEPSDLQVFMDHINDMKAMAPGFYYKVAINHIEFMGHNIPHVVDYCPSLHCAANKYEELVEVQKGVEGTVTYYVCCSPAYPNTFINSPAIESRIIPWISWVLGLDGFLRWNYTVWPDDPLNNLSIRFPIWPAGDTNFVYPGKNGKPMLSLRYMNLKRGIRDYEIIRKYSKAHDAKEEINALMKKVFYWDHTSDIATKEPKDLYAFDQEAYNAIIVHMLNKLKA